MDCFQALSWEDKKQGNSFQRTHSNRGDLCDHEHILTHSVMKISSGNIASLRGSLRGACPWRMEVVMPQGMDSGEGST